MTAGLFTGKLHPLAFALVALIVPVHAVMATNFGLVFTVRAKSTARAGLSFTLALLLICVAGVIGMAGMVALFGSPSHRTEFPLAAVWLPPAATAGVLSAPHMWNQPRTADEALPLIGGAIAGTLLYAGVAVWLWGLALRRFEREWEGRP